MTATGARHGAIPGWASSGAGMLAIMVTVMWAVEVVDVVVPGLDLDVHGIRPRALSGLDGIVWAPFLHGGFGHLASNTVPLLVLGGLVLLRGRQRWLSVTAAVALGGGTLTWLAARGELVHIGASILVFGYAGYLLTAGFVERSPGGIVIAVIVVVIFGGTLLSGILPFAIPGVSWEGHLFGLAAGAATGFATGPSRTLEPRQG